MLAMERSVCYVTRVGLLMVVANTAFSNRGLQEISLSLCPIRHHVKHCINKLPITSIAIDKSSNNIVPLLVLLVIILFMLVLIVIMLWLNNSLTLIYKDKYELIKRRGESSIYVALELLQCKFLFL